MNNENTPNQPAENERLYTQSEVDALVAQQEQALRDALAQADALTAQLNALEQRSRDEEADTREKQLEKRERHARAVEALASQSLPVQLADALDYTDEERFAASLEAIGALFAQAVQRGVEMRLRGAIPTVGTSEARPGTLREAIERRYAGV